MSKLDDTSIEVFTYTDWQKVRRILLVYFNEAVEKTRLTRLEEELKTNNERFLARERKKFKNRKILI